MPRIASYYVQHTDSIFQPAKTSRQTILLTCTVADGVGDLKHLVNIAKLSLPYCEHFRVGLIMSVPGWNEAALRFLLAEVDTLDHLFDFMFIKIQKHAQLNSNSSGNNMMIKSHIKPWSDLPDEFRRTLTHKISPYDTPKQLRKSVRDCCMVVNISTTLLFKPETAKQNLSQMEWVTHPIESILCQWLPPACPILSINELGFETNTSPFMMFNFGSRQPKRSDYPTIYDANMGYTQKDVGLRLYHDYQRSLSRKDKIILVKHCQSPLKSQLLSALEADNPRHIAIAYLQDDFMNMLFITTQIRRALKENVPCDIYISKTQCPIRVLEEIIARLQKELGLAEAPATIVTTTDRPDAAIRVFVHDHYSETDNDILWRLADYSLGVSGDDTLSRALSSSALPMFMFTHVTKIQLTNKFVDFIKRHRPNAHALINYMEQASFSENWLDFVMIRGRFDDDRIYTSEPSVVTMKEKKICSVLAYSKSLSECITPSCLEEWQACRELIASTQDISKHIAKILAAGLNLAKKAKLYEESISIKSVSRANVEMMMIAWFKNQFYYPFVSEFIDNDGQHSRLINEACESEAHQDEPLKPALF